MLIQAGLGVAFDRAECSATCTLQLALLGLPQHTCNCSLMGHAAVPFRPSPGHQHQLRSLSHRKQGLANIGRARPEGRI